MSMTDLSWGAAPTMRCGGIVAARCSHLFVHVSDLDRIREFYAEVVGLEHGVPPEHLPRRGDLPIRRR